jgi:hypothetical protein
MNRPRFRLRTLMLVMAATGSLLGLCRLIVDLMRRGWVGLAMALSLLVIIPILLLVQVVLSVLMAHVIERVYRRLKGG